MIKNKIINIIKKHNLLYLIVSLLYLIKNSKIIKISGGRKKYPEVIQLPITYKCNSHCVMCNIWKMDNSNEMNIKEFKLNIEDDIFKKVKAVGINGGEPFLVPNLEEYLKALLKLPKIKSINIISNGFLTKLILKKLEIIYKLCKTRNINFHVSFSLDGYGEIHNKVRNIPNAFDKVTETVDTILKNKKKYCDSINLGCTVTKQNINNLVELETYATLKGYDIKYRLGISNKRIESNKILDDFNILTTKKYKQSAKEFFFKQMGKSKQIYNKFKYFSIFYFLENDNPKRLLGCTWKEKGITLDSKGNIYYCAVESKKIGTLREQKGEDIFFNKKNIQYRKSIIEKKCYNCIHDYNGDIEFNNLIPFIRYLIKQFFKTYIYKIKNLIIGK